jgi:hypothetical protein
VSGVNRRFLLRERPTGRIDDRTFELVEEPVPVIGEGEALVRTRWISRKALLRPQRPLSSVASVSSRFAETLALHRRHQEIEMSSKRRTTASLFVAPAAHVLPADHVPHRVGLTSAA